MISGVFARDNIVVWCGTLCLIELLMHPLPLAMLFGVCVNLALDIYTILFPDNRKLSYLVCSNSNIGLQLNELPFI